MAVGVVTGAAGGMGAAIAQALGQGGLQVIGVDVAEIPAGVCHQSLAGSVLDVAVAEAAFELALAHGDEVFLVNNAGVTVPGAPQTDEAFARTIEVNLAAPFAWARLFARHVAEGRIRSGGIVFIGSLATQLGFPNNPAYQASKSGVLGLSRAFAYDLGPAGIRVNCVSPGYIATAMTRTSFADPQMKADRARHTLLGRWGRPEDVADAVAFLCSPSAAYITGTNLFVDGGWTCKGLIETDG